VTPTVTFTVTATVTTETPSATGSATVTATSSPTATLAPHEVIIFPLQDTYVATAVEIPLGLVGNVRSGEQNAAEFLALVQFRLDELPREARIESALLQLWCTGSIHVAPGGAAPFEVVRPLSPWDENVVIYSSKPNISGPKLAWDIPRCGTAGAPGHAPGWREVEIKDLVSAWLDGRLANYGVQIGLRAVPAGHLFTFVSKEGASPGAPGPQLRVSYRLPPKTPPIPPPTQGPVP
jgi:hypothetical protein